MWSVPELVDRYLRATARISPLKLHWTEIAQRGVAAAVIVKADVVKPVGFRLLVAGVASQVYPLSLQGTEEALHRSVVPAVPWT